MKQIQVPVAIERHEEIYIAHLLGDGDAGNRENGLERLCKHLRVKRYVRHKPKILTLLVGLLQDETRSVRRWALNALALMGSASQTVAIQNAIYDNREDLDTFGAGISALAAISNSENIHKIFADNDLALENGVLFAAAQQCDAFKEELRATRVNIENTSDSDLRLVMLLLGLGKAPEHFFSSRHRNRDVVGDLNTHQDRLVAQYSVWATFENPKLGLKDLRISLKDVAGQRPNVRKYIYRLISSREVDAKRHYDRLVEGSQDPQVEVRAGLAEGLRNLCFDAIDDLALNWFKDEQNEIVRQALLEHMAVNIEALPNYREPVLVSYQHAARDSLLRSRLEAASQATPLFRDLKAIAIEQEQKDLFDERESALETSAMRTGKQMSSGRSFKKVDFETLANSAKVLVVTALPKELAAAAVVLNAQKEVFSKTGDTNLYQLGLVQSANRGTTDRAVLITSSGMGNVSAAALAANAIRSYQDVQHIIMVGIAGGCPNVQKADEHIRLGDVVTSSEKGIIAYGSMKETNEVREIRTSAQAPSAQLLSVQRVLGSGALQNRKPWLTYIEEALQVLGVSYGRPTADQDILHVDGAPVDHPDQRNRVSGEPMIHSGVIGASDTLQKNAETRDRLRDNFGVRAIEMEAAGLQTAAWAQGKDVFVVRGICDYCDAFKNDDWQNYSALAASAYARSMIEIMPANWFPAPN